MAPQQPAAISVDGITKAGTGDLLVIDDPSTGAVIDTFASAAFEDLDEPLTRAEAAAEHMRRLAPLDRSRLLSSVAQQLRANLESLAILVATDAGLPLPLAQRDVEAAARYFEYYAAVCQSARGQSIPLGEGLLDVIEREPYGTCLIILPFNFPMQLAARDCAPALAAGNSVILKAAEQAPLAALALADICARAGAPSAAVTTVVGGASLAQALIADPRVAHVTFTGSQRTGVHVMRACAEQLKPVTLELGGKSPHVVFADADLDAVVSSVLATTMRTAGQACSAGSRIIAEKTIRGELLQRLEGAVAALRVGPALDSPDVGPLISRAQRDTVLRGIGQSIADGAALITGNATEPTDTGWFVQPTVLAYQDPQTHAEQHELFGPVVGVSEFQDEAQAVARANHTDFGLVAGIWTKDIDRALRVSRKIRAGQVFVNTYGVGSGVELPFGGIKASGFGRVKGLEALHEYTTSKNIQIAIKEQ